MRPFFRDEARFFAFGFWMWYPDYLNLAEELLDRFEQTIKRYCINKGIRQCMSAN